VFICILPKCGGGAGGAGGGGADMSPAKLVTPI